MNQYWIMLLIASGLEVVWAIALKYMHGFSRPSLSFATLLAMAVSRYLLARSAGGLPIGTASAVWTRIGAAGTAVAGMLLLNESRDLARVMCIGLIIVGVVGLKTLAEEDGGSALTEAASQRSD
jgi:quaternary ammonium compound-resistance protein SugE